MGTRRTDSWLFVAAVFLDEVVGGGVVGELWRVGALQFADDFLGEDFAEFDAPLIEGIDAPDGALREDRVFVEGD